MSDIENLKTEIALLKKDAKTGELIHQRLEIAIDKLSEIVISCNSKGAGFSIAKGSLFFSIL